MTTMTKPAAAGLFGNGWACLTAPWTHFAGGVTTADHRSMAQAIKTLSRYSDRELSDIGLSRSDLSPEGLETAGARRRRRQAADAGPAPHSATDAR